MAARKLVQESPALPETTHRFTNDHPLIFPDLHYPDPENPERGGVHVVRANPVVGEDGNPAPESGIVVLHPGDEVALPEGYEHAWLELINPPLSADNGDEPAGEANTEELS